MDLFPASYFESRERLGPNLETANFIHQVYPMQSKGPQGAQLSIDVGIQRREGSDRALVITSGTHGVEGYFGAAVQSAFLSNSDLLEVASHCTVILIHALNPHGFAWNRRFNEDNVDLNRSFFNSGEDRPKTLEDFHQFEPLLAPKMPPAALDSDTFRVLFGKHDLPYLKRILPVGQYDYPRCLFYGGNSASEAQTILATHLPEWVGNTEHITLIDFHTGLGDWASYKLLISKNAGEEEINYFSSIFGVDNIEKAEIYDTGEGVSYDARGTFPAWFKTQFPGRKCYAATAEFGTYNEMRVLLSLIAENSAHFYGDQGNEHAWTSNDLIEMFSPADPDWRAKVIVGAETILRQALR